MGVVEMVTIVAGAMAVALFWGGIIDGSKAGD